MGFPVLASMESRNAAAGTAPSSASNANRVDIPASGTVGGDDVVDDIGQEDAAYREELIGKGKQTADIDRLLKARPNVYLPDP